MNQVATIPQERKSLVATMAQNYDMEPSMFARTVKATCMPNSASDEEFAAFLMVAHEHGLNPITREIYAFPKKGGGVQPIVGIDGWMTLINSHPDADGLEFEDRFDEKSNLVAVTAMIYRKDRSRPVSVTEYMDECKRPTEPWQKWPKRMLRHKAAIQCARYAFGFAGIIDPDEAERSPEVITGTELVQAPPPPAGKVQEITAEPLESRGSSPAGEQEGITTPDLGKFLEQMDAAMMAAQTVDDVHEAWNEADAEATFEGDDTAIEVARKVYGRHLKGFGENLPEDLMGAG